MTATPNTIERFWDKVNKTQGCWLWTASKRDKGYGAFVWRNGINIIQGRAHRFSWEIHYGEIPKGLCVLHKCDVPACVNPEHLFLGTKADNNNDMDIKGRRVIGGTYNRQNYKRGEKHPNAKLDEHTIRCIRIDQLNGLSYSKLARKYNISIGFTWRICNRKVWVHVD